jgi:hypothetical protein
MDVLSLQNLPGARGDEAWQMATSHQRSPQCYPPSHDVVELIGGLTTLPFAGHSWTNVLARAKVQLPPNVFLVARTEIKKFTPLHGFS